jgi:hypothetical protein
VFACRCQRSDSPVLPGHQYLEHDQIEPTGLKQQPAGLRCARGGAHAKPSWRRTRHQVADLAAAVDHHDVRQGST